MRYISLTESESFTTKPMTTSAFFLKSFTFFKFKECAKKSRYTYICAKHQTYQLVSVTVLLNLFFSSKETVSSLEHLEVTTGKVNIKIHNYLSKILQSQFTLYVYNTFFFIINKIFWIDFYYIIRI